VSKPGWQSKLSRPISLKTGTKLETLADARAFILDMLPESDHDRSSWQHATELLIEAAERGAASRQRPNKIERALFLQGMWMPK
jgi:redox-regulated HSP33 family molecular chaperone